MSRHFATRSEQQYERRVMRYLNNVADYQLVLCAAGVDAGCDFDVCPRVARADHG